MTVIRKLFNISSILGFLLFFSCSPKIVYVPVESNTSTRDSVVLNIIDSTVIHHKTINRDYAGLLDTLRIQGEHSSMTAWADTTKFSIKGELKEDPYRERIIYKDRYIYKDSLVYQEKPVPYEVTKEVKFVPWYHKALSFLGIIAIIAGLILTVIKLKL